MTILIGYVPTPQGEAALHHGLTEAATRDEDVVILNSPRRGSTVDAHLVGEAESERLVAQAAERGVRRGSSTPTTAPTWSRPSTSWSPPPAPGSSSSACGAGRPSASW